MDQTSRKKYLIVDATNLLYRAFFASRTLDAHIKGLAEEASEDAVIAMSSLAHYNAFLTMNKYFKKYKPYKMVVAFDRRSWRKEYTASDECISKVPYKGNRRANMSAQDMAKFEMFIAHINDFENILREHTSVICLAEQGLEADDMIAWFVAAHPEDHNIVVSADKDLVQLLADNVELIDPATGENRLIEDHGGTVEYFLFEKCIRGDRGDNVMSAFPRVRSTRIAKAWEVPYERIALMNERWTGADGRTHKVQDIFEENKLLMSLYDVPEDIQKQAIKAVINAEKNVKKYSHFHLLAFLTKYKIQAVKDQLEVFTPMLST